MEKYRRSTCLQTSHSRVLLPDLWANFGRADIRLGRGQVKIKAVSFLRLAVCHQMGPLPHLPPSPPPHLRLGQSGQTFKIVFIPMIKWGRHPAAPSWMWCRTGGLFLDIMQRGSFFIVGLRGHIVRCGGERKIEGGELNWTKLHAHRPPMLSLSLSLPTSTSKGFLIDYANVAASKSFLTRR